MHSYSLGPAWSYRCQVCGLCSHACCRFASLSWKDGRRFQIVNSECSRIAIDVVSSLSIHRWRNIIFIWINLLISTHSAIWSQIVATLERAGLATPSSNAESPSLPSASSCSYHRFFNLRGISFIPCIWSIHLKLCLLRIRIDIRIVILSSA